MKSDSHNVYLGPILSPIGTYDCSLASFLAHLLDPVIPQEHCVKDCINFCGEM